MHTNDLISMHMGYYIQYGTPLIISENKSIVKGYLKNHRFLKKGQFEIIKEDLRPYDIYETYKDQIASNYGDYFLPAIDIEIMDYYQIGTDAELRSLLEGIKKYTILANDIKEITKREMESLLNTIKIFDKFISDVHLNETITLRDSITSGILYMPIEEYLKSLTSYNNIKMHHLMFHYQMDKED